MIAAVVAVDRAYVLYVHVHAIQCLLLFLLLLLLLLLLLFLPLPPSSFSSSYSSSFSSSFSSSSSSSSSFPPLPPPPPPEVFSSLCSQHLPDVHSHLEQLQVLTMVSVSWFLTLFLTVFDHRTATIILDCFFVDGSKVSKPTGEMTACPSSCTYLSKCASLSKFCLTCSGVQHVLRSHLNACCMD